MGRIQKTEEETQKTKEEYEELALGVIEDYRLFFITDISAYLPFSRETFYHHNLHKSDSIKKAINKNVIHTKQSLKNKWYKSNQPTLQVALYKLIGTDKERSCLGTKTETKEDGHQFNKRQEIAEDAIDTITGMFESFANTKSKGIPEAS